MLFGMFKEKEVIDNTNFDTTNGDIVEDFGGVINNQSNDKDLIPLTSFTGSYSEDINYQNVDLNNPQTIINSINNNGMQGVTNNYSQIPGTTNLSMPVYPNIPIQNNSNANYQNIPTNNYSVINTNNMQQQGYAVYPNMNGQNIPQPIQQNIQTNSTANYPQNQIQPSIPNTMNAEKQVPVQPTNENNSDINSPVKILTELPKKEVGSDLSNALLNTPTPQPIQQDINNDVNNSENKDTLNSPIEIIEELPKIEEKVSQISTTAENSEAQITDMSITTSDETVNNVEIQQENSEMNEKQEENQFTKELFINTDIVNDSIPKSIDDEIKNNPIPSMISLIPNNDNIQNNGINNTVELPPIIDPITSQNNVEPQENSDIQPQEVQKEIDINNNEHEHKFIISDEIDVEPGFKICPKCGQKIRDDYRLCFVCGTYF